MQQRINKLYFISLEQHRSNVLTRANITTSTRIRARLDEARLREHVKIRESWIATGRSGRGRTILKFAGDIRCYPVASVLQKFRDLERPVYKYTSSSVQYTSSASSRSLGKVRAVASEGKKGVSTGAGGWRRLERDKVSNGAGAYSRDWIRRYGRPRAEKNASV